MDQRLKDVAREASKEAASEAVSALGKWLLSRPRIAKVLKRRPLLAKLVGAK